MKVCIARPGEPPRIEEISKGLRAMQEVVGGPIELVSVDDLDLWVCEEGIPMGMPFNRTVRGHPLVGTILVTSSDREGETIGLTDAQARKAVDLLLDSPAFYTSEDGRTFSAL